MHNKLKLFILISDLVRAKRFCPKFLYGKFVKILIFIGLKHIE